MTTCNQIHYSPLCIYKGIACCQLSIKTKVNLIHEKRGRKCPIALMLYSSDAASDKWSYNADVETFTLIRRISPLGWNLITLMEWKQITVDLSLRKLQTWKFEWNFRQLFKGWPAVLFTTCSIERKIEESHVSGWSNLRTCVWDSDALEKIFVYLRISPPPENIILMSNRVMEA